MPNRYLVIFYLIIMFFVLAGIVVFGLIGWNVMAGALVGVASGLSVCWFVGGMVPDNEPDHASIARRNIINELSREHGMPEPYPAAERRGATKNEL